MPSHLKTGSRDMKIGSRDVLLLKNMFIMTNLTNFRKKRGGNRCGSTPLQDMTE